MVGIKKTRGRKMRSTPPTTKGGVLIRRWLTSERDLKLITILTFRIKI